MKHFIRSMDWDNWIYGLFYGMIGGGAGAVVNAFATAAMDPEKFSFEHGRFYILIGFAFMVNGLIAACGYLKQNPLPKITTTTTVETTVVRKDPPATVVTTVEKTENK